MACNRDDHQPSTSSGGIPWRSTELSCRLSWHRRRADDKRGIGGGRAIRFDVIFVEKCRRRRSGEFEFPVEAKSFFRQAREFLGPPPAVAAAVREMLAEICLDGQWREQFTEVIAEYVRQAEVAQRAAAEKEKGVVFVVEAEMEVISIVYDDDDDDDHEKEVDVSASASEEEEEEEEEELFEIKLS